MRNAESEMRNLKCGTTLIGQSSKPRNCYLSAYYRNDIYIDSYHNRQSGKMQTRNGENANIEARMHLALDTTYNTCC